MLFPEYIFIKNCLFNNVMIIQPVHTHVKYYGLCVYAVIFSSILKIKFPLLCI